MIFLEGQIYFYEYSGTKFISRINEVHDEYITVDDIWSENFHENSSNLPLSLSEISTIKNKAFFIKVNTSDVQNDENSILKATQEQFPEYFI